MVGLRLIDEQYRRRLENRFRQKCCAMTIKGISEVEPAKWYYFAIVSWSLGSFVVVTRREKLRGAASNDVIIIVLRLCLLIHPFQSLHQHHRLAGQEIR
jgi:hypothetical protein